MSQTAHSNIPDELRVPHESYEAEVLRRVWDRLNKRNEHAMIAFVGEEGSGKSYTAQKVAKAIDPTFTADRVMFEISELLKILRDGDHEPGNVYVLDESGVAFGNRTWQERGQILANQALQLIRSHNIALFFTLPRLGELDSQTKGRLQAYYEITKKRPDEYVEGKWKYLDPDRSGYSGDIYEKFPRIYRDGQKIKVRKLKFAPPPDELVAPYEERKQEYQEEVYERTISELEDSEIEEEEDEKGPKDIAQEIKDDGLDDVVSIHRGHNKPQIDADLIRLEYDVSTRAAKTVKKLLERDQDVSLADTHAGQAAST